MKRACAIGVLFGLGCTRTASDPVVVPAPSASAARPVTMAPNDAGGGIIEAAPMSTWRAPPKESGSLFVAIDGLCTNLLAVPAGTGAVLTYGGEWGNPNYDGPPRKRLGTGTLGALGDALDVRGAVEVTRLRDAYGAASGDMWAVDDTRTRADGGSGNVVVHHYVPGIGWDPKGDLLKRDLDAAPAEWLSGSLIAYTRRQAAMVSFWSTKPDVDIPPDVSLPEDMKVDKNAGPWDSGLAFADADARSGTVALALSWYPREERQQTPTVKFRIWQKARGWKDLPGASWPSWIERVVVSGEIDITAQSDKAVFHWNGKAWSKVIDEKVKSEPAEKRASGGVFALGADGKLRIVDASGAVSAIAAPKPFESYAADGDHLAATGKSGKLYEKNDAGSAWEARTLPAPTFGTSKDVKARLVRIGKGGTLYVVAKYWEKGRGWTESELHWMLVTSKKTKETYRCNEPDPENNNYNVGIGFQSWAPFADASCKRPFVVVARKSKAQENVFADLAKKLATPGTAFVSFTSGDRTFLGARADDLAAGEALAKKAVPMRLRPEIVCGEPDDAAPLGP